MNITPLIKKYKEEILYIIFGAVTTAVNILSYIILYNILHIGNVPATVVAWLASVIVAFITNKLWVFESKSFRLQILLKEASAFFSCRLLTGMLDVFIMWMCVDLLFLPSTLVKILSNVIVIILNYLVSKVFIFKS